MSCLVPTATDKVALLIGNMNYLYHTQLCAPIADVHELTNFLRQMDFKVVSLLDLNWQEMHSAVTEFLLLLDKGVYGLFWSFSTRLKAAQLVTPQIQMKVMLLFTVVQAE